MFNTITLLLAPFVLYTLLAGGMAYLVVLAIDRRLSPTPRTRTFLYIGVLVAPLITYAGYLFHIWRSCAGYYGEFYNRLCAISIRYSGFLSSITLFLLGGYLVYRALLHFGSPIRSKTKSINRADLQRLSQCLQALPGGSHVETEVWENCYPNAYVRGYKSPRIVVTSGLLELLDNEELQGVLAHELAHVRRRDNYLNWVFIFRELTFFSPFAQVAYAGFSQAREEAADIIATSGSDERSLALASALIKVAKRAQELIQLTQLSFTHSYFTGAQGVTRRVELLVSGEQNYSSLSPIFPLAVLVALM
ncbi:MAG: M56 family metallopeptidase, partial [Bacillota bacterium]|nr:M56 family metallopeptidase [Bacillota bacterium]